MGNNNRKGIGSFNYRPSSSGPKLTGIDSLLSNQAAIQKQDTLQQTAVPDAQQIIGQMQTLQGGAPAGSKFNQGGVDIPLNREFTKDEINILNNFDAVNEHVNGLKSQMTMNPEAFKKNFVRANVPFGEIGSKDAQLIKFSLNDMSDRLLRLRSGAAINQDEFQRLRGLLPSLMDITSGDFSVINKKLDTFNAEFSNARNRVMGGSQFEQNRGVSSILPTGGGSSPQTGVKDPLEGRTATGPNGKLKRMGGKWVPI